MLYFLYYIILHADETKAIGNRAGQTDWEKAISEQRARDEKAGDLDR